MGLALKTSPHASSGSVSGELRFAQQELTAFGGASIALKSLDIFLKPSSDLESFEGAQKIEIAPSQRVTQLWVAAKVGAAEISRIRSAAAAAMLRRRRAAKVARQVRSLKAQVERQDFHAVTFPSFDELRRFHEELMPHELTEGNTAMILRYARNTFFDKSRERYRDPIVIESVAAIFETLGSLETIGPKQASETFGTFVKLGLRPSLPVEIDQEDDHDGDAEVEG
jgi:hypothetical protein